MYISCVCGFFENEMRILMGKLNDAFQFDGPGSAMEKAYRKLTTFFIKIMKEKEKSVGRDFRKGWKLRLIFFI
jgi:hypothetical protein